MSLSIPYRPEPWTVDDLPEEGRFEIVDGALVMSPAPSLPHEAAVSVLHYLLAGELGPTRVLTTGGIVFRRTSYRVPDVMVLREGISVREQREIGPSDVLFVVEVVSPSSVTTDHLVKRAQYAAAGIEHYWIVELDPDLRLAALALVGDAYVESGAWRDGETVRVETPVPLTFELSSLLG